LKKRKCDSITDEEQETRSNVNLDDSLAVDAEAAGNDFDIYNTDSVNHLLETQSNNNNNSGITDFWATMAKKVFSPEEIMQNAALLVRSNQTSSVNQQYDEDDHFGEFLKINFGFR